MTNHAFFGDPAEVRAAVTGGTLTLIGSEAHHAATVKRVVPGETIDVVDGEGRRLSCTVAKATPAAVVVAVDKMSFDPPPGMRFVLVQALAKGDRAELAVEAATELGVDGVLPWQADRSIVRWRAEKAAKGHAKWESLVRTASKQSRRTRVPEVFGVLDSKGLGNWLSGVEHALLLHEEATESLADYWNRAPLGGTGTLAVIVGPEGGISPHELEMLAATGAVPVQLGANVLRASTAGPAAIAVLNHLIGRW